MGARRSRASRDDAGERNAMRREEIDVMLDAIVGAIAAGKLPPDDACAWAKIAAHEAEMLTSEPSALQQP